MTKEEKDKIGKEAEALTKHDGLKASIVLLDTGSDCPTIGINGTLPCVSALLAMALHIVAKDTGNVDEYLENICKIVRDADAAMAIREAEEIMEVSEDE